jgi:hypothetical protein
MEPRFLFPFYNYFAMAGWLFLVFLPGKKITRMLVLNGAWSIVIAVSYLVFLIVGMLQPGGEGGFGSVQEVMKIFSDEWGVLTGWVHYLCFDLLIGCWEVTDARKNKISHWIVLPCLFFTFLLGPIGFLFYWIVRMIRLKKADVLF